MVKHNESLRDDEIIWRYLTIDKLYDLLNTKEMFLAPLKFFFESDPFEGAVPKSALNALYSHMVNVVPDGISTEEFMNNQYDDYRKYVSSITVNCWHSSVHESEAMWKLYTQQGNGVAIKSSVGRLSKSIIEDTKFEISIGRVKYLDFMDSSIDPNECLSDGKLWPLLKRKSYEHEKEIRIYIEPRTAKYNQSVLIPPPSRIRINPDELIDEVILSPYSSELFHNVAIGICEKLGVASEKLKPSLLLTGIDELFTWKPKKSP